MLSNNIGKEGAETIVSVAKDKPQLTTLCGITPEQTEADFRNQDLKVGDIILLSFDLSKNSALVKLK